MNDTTADTAAPPRELIKPGQRLVQALVGWVLLGGAVHFVPGLSALIPVWLVLGAALGALALLDLRHLVRENPDLAIERHTAARWAVNAPATVNLEITQHTHRPLTLMVHDDHPKAIRADSLPMQCRLEPGERIRLGWRALPLERGEFNLEGCHLAWLSRLGLWWRRRQTPLKSRVRVYPDFTLVGRYALLAAEQRLGEMGIHRRARRGLGSDFHQLRDYRDGDSPRQIDWRATSRMRRLIARDYQEESDQRVVFLLDCSRRMRTRVDELSHFDHCLNALLLLTHVALRQGDEVALQTLAAPENSERRVAAGRGERQYARILESLFDLDAGHRHPDFHRAAGELLEAHHRRSLVVVLTNLRDEDHDELDDALRVLGRRHRVILADLRERIADIGQQPSVDSIRGDFDSALLQAACSQYREQRRVATARLHRHDVIHLDTSPDELPARLVNQYREIKAGGSI